LDSSLVNDFICTAFVRLTDMPSAEIARPVMNDIDDDRDEFAFAELDPTHYLNMRCSWSSPCAEAVRDDPTRSTPASTRWCAVRSARHRA
jgi:hypothetical protein